MGRWCETVNGRDTAWASTHADSKHVHLVLFETKAQQIKSATTSNSLPLTREKIQRKTSGVYTVARVLKIRDLGLGLDCR